MSKSQHKECKKSDSEEYIYKEGFSLRKRYYERIHIGLHLGCEREKASDPMPSAELEQITESQHSKHSKRWSCEDIVHRLQDLHRQRSFR